MHTLASLAGFRQHAPCSFPREQQHGRNKSCVGWSAEWSTGETIGILRSINIIAYMMVVTNHRLHCNKWHLMASSRYLLDCVFLMPPSFSFLLQGAALWTPAMCKHDVPSIFRPILHATGCLLPSLLFWTYTGSAAPCFAITPKMLLLTSSIIPYTNIHTLR